LNTRPSVVLLCHDDDLIDRDGLASWLAATMRLTGIVTIHDPASRRWHATRREFRRSGWIGVADVLAFRALYALTRRTHDRAWCAAEAARLQATYPAALDEVPRLSVTNPNASSAQEFIRACAPDLTIARCKWLLRRETFSIARVGTFVLHPGICPEYRNAHGCFWALANRDLERVGATLLRVDEGIDTGPVYLRTSCEFDERVESHTVIQYRAVTEHLDAIARTLIEICRGQARPLESHGRQSGVWGQPRLSAYLKWQRAAKHRHAHHLAALS
jgi:formyl transferase-like protein